MHHQWLIVVAACWISGQITLVLASGPDASTRRIAAYMIAGLLLPVIGPVAAACSRTGILRAP